MKLSLREKKVLYAFGCPNYQNTVTRMKWLTALTVDPEAKRRMLELARKLEMETDESWYNCFYHHLDRKSTRLNSSHPSSSRMPSSA